MTTLRFLFILLLVLNVLAFAAINGWLGSAAPAGEPERISNQLRPEQIRLVTAGSDEAPAAPPKSASTSPLVDAPPPPEEPTAPPAQAGDSTTPAPVAASATETAPATVVDTRLPEPAACVAWADLATGEADVLAARLSAAGFEFTRSRRETPSNWWVRIPPQGSRGQAEQKVRELRELGITDTFIVQETGPTQYAVSLGLFRTERSASQLLAQLHARGARDAGIEPRLTTTFRIQATLPKDKVAALEGRRSQFGNRRVRCTP